MCIEVKVYIHTLRKQSIVHCISKPRYPARLSLIVDLRPLFVAWIIKRRIINCEISVVHDYIYISQGSQKSSFKQSIIHYINELQYYNETTLNICYILKMAVRVKYHFFY